MNKNPPQEDYSMKKILKNYGFIIMMLTGIVAGCVVGAIVPHG